MSYLAAIAARKRIEIAERSRLALPPPRLADRPARSLRAALAAAPERARIIAEIKRASPSAGAIAQVDAASQARRYEEAGAAAISVLTDGPGFGGSLADLSAARAATSLPLLQKDFVLAPSQLAEARAHGADAVLLIVALLGPATGDFLREARSLGLEALVECHEEEELSLALDLGAEIVGINSRKLATMQVDLAVSERLLARIPRGVIGVAESGIRGPEDAARMRRAGARGLLVGEALMRAGDLAGLLARLEGP